MHIAILVTNTDHSAFADRHPKDGEKFTQFMHSVRPDWQMSVYQVESGAFPDSLAPFDGLIITGSPASLARSKARKVEPREGSAAKTVPAVINAPKRL